jgi:CP family cyanate transporter-like MFS transporter
MTKVSIGKKNVVYLIAIFTIALNMRPAITSIGPMLDVIRLQLSLSNTQVTLLTAVPVICMGVFASLAPILSRKFGLKATMYVLILIVSCMTASRGIFPGYGVLLFTAFIIGLAIAVMGPLVSAMIKQNFSTQASSVISLYSFGMGVGASVSAGLTVVLFQQTESYTFALSSWSVLGVAGLVFWYLAMKNQVAIQVALPSANAVVPKHSRSPWKTKRAWYFLLFFGLQSSIFFSVITWLAPIVTSTGMSLLEAGSILSMMTVVQIIMNLLYPALMTRYPARQFWVFVLLVLGVVAIGLFWTGIPVCMWIGAFVMGIPLGGLFPISLLLPLDETTTADETNSWTAMMQTGGFIIGGLIPLLIAVVYDATNDHRFTFLILLVLFLLLVLLTFLIGDKKE